MGCSSSKGDVTSKATAKTNKDTDLPEGWLHFDLAMDQGIKSFKGGDLQ